MDTIDKTIISIFAIIAVTIISVLTLIMYFNNAFYENAFKNGYQEKTIEGTQRTIWVKNDN